MTILRKAISRETAKTYNSVPVVVTLAPAGTTDEALIGLRLKGRRTQYVVALSDVYRVAAQWHGLKVSNAKRQARKQGISWRIAKRAFDRNNRI